MYEKYSFLTEEELSVKTFKEALEITNDRKHEVIKAPFKEIKATSEGHIVLNNKELQVTKWGFEKFCGLLGIPKPFARKIPEDLLDNNIARLIKEQNQDENLLFFNSTKGLLGVAKEKSDPFGNIDFITQMTTLHSGKIDIHDILVSDRGITVNFFTNIPSVEPKKGDVVRIGFNAHNSDTGGAPTAGNLFMFRLVCTNGAMAGEVWGSAKRTHNRKITKETSLINFAKEMEGMSVNADLLTKCFVKMAELQVRDTSFKRFWVSTKRVTGSDASTDEALNIEADDRKEMFAKIAKRQNTNRKNLIENLQPESPAELDRTYYDLYNQITAIEKNFKMDDRIALRRIGGDVLYKILKSEVSNID